MEWWTAALELNIQKYMAFLRTVEYGSFTKAADMLNYSQSGISRMIADLEKEWKVTLLERGRTGVRLTSDGMKLLPYARGVCEQYQKLQMEVDELNGLQSGFLRIGTFSSVATHWLPNIIRAFQKDYPNIHYELLLGDYEEIETWISEGRVDCGFLRLPTGGEFETTFLAQDDFLAVLPEEHPLAKLSKVPLSALCGDPFLLLEKGGNTEVSDLFRRGGLTPKIHCTLWDDYAILSMVESGLGISMLPRLILRRIPYHVALRELDVPAFRRIGLALRDRKTASLALKRFLDYLPYRDEVS